MRIAVAPGDGIGKEVTAEAVKVLDAVAEISGGIEYEHLDLGSDRYLRTGELLTDEDVKAIKRNDALLFGAIGDPRVAPGVLEKGILIRMRTVFDQYVNMRPAKAWHPYTPLKGDRDFNITFLRENTEDMYMGAGGVLQGPKDQAGMSLSREMYKLDLTLQASSTAPDEIAFEIGLMTRRGVERFAEHVFLLAKETAQERVVAVDKANVCTSLYGLWRQVFNAKSDEHGIPVDFMYVDAMAMALVRRPEKYGIVACPNMFGDILTDIGAEIMGGLGVAASGNISPGGVSMFEPVHGSAPDIAGQGKANPVAAVLAAKMMLDSLGRRDLGQMVESAVRGAMDARLVTADMGGRLTTSQAGDAIADLVRKSR